MEISIMSQGYAKEAETISQRITELEATIQRGGISVKRRLRLRARITALEDIRIELRSTARHLSHYYN